MIDELHAEAQERPIDQSVRLVLDRTGYQRMLEAGSESRRLSRASGT